MATITQEPISQLHEKISVKLDKTDYLPAFEKSLKEYSKKANIPGFRPGKVPSGMIKKMYGPSLFVDEVLRSVDKELIEYLQKENIDIFAQPLPLETDDLSKLDVNNPQDYTFDFEVGLKPAFEMADLAKADIKAYNIDITDKMVAEEIERLQNRFGNMTDKEAVDGSENILNVVFEELDADGNILEGGKRVEDSLLLKYFADKTQKDFMGKKAGDEVEITLGKAFSKGEAENIAKDLGLNEDDAATKKKKYKVAITKVGQLEKRELNEEFFEQLHPGGEVKSEDDLKAKTRDEIFNYWASQSRNQIHDQIFHSLIDNTKIDFPEAFLKKWMVSQNSQPQEGQPAKSEEQIEKEMPTFLNQLKWTLISDKIVNDQAISVSPDELRAFTKQQLFNYMGANAPMVEEQDWVNDYVDRMMKDRKYIEDSYNRLQSEKLFNWAETQVKPTSTPINADDFTKMVNEHQHSHH
ncbi:MAG: trigger factor [Niabella sp.]